MESLSAARPLVPRFLLDPFADDAGRVMVERRDRSRRLLLPAEGAAAEAGGYDPGGPELARTLDAAEARARETLRAIVAGTFPVGGEDRRALSLFLGIRLLLARGHRAERARAAETIGALVVT
ncbi:MAG: hypothetical protein ACREMB_18460, partial [Candidatus Rokuibacteriota bacterium]